MYRVGVGGKFMARHALSGDFGEECVEHAHEYVVEVVCTADDLDRNGFSVDIALLEERLERLLMGIDDRFLNEMDFFRGLQPSVENTCRYIHRELGQSLSSSGFDLGGVGTCEIILRESPTAWASYGAPLCGGDVSG